MQKILKNYKRDYREANNNLFHAVESFRNGNKKSFSKIYKLSENYIYSIIFNITEDNDKTADIMQDTYIQIYKSLYSLKDVEAFFPWAGRIATNKTLRSLQRDTKEVLLKEEEHDFIFEYAHEDKEEFLPEDILSHKEKKERLHQIIEGLSEVQKASVFYYYFSEMSVSEIAQTMECSTGTVKSRLNYARKQIKNEVMGVEKREGLKLYSLSSLPIFLYLFRENLANLVIPDSVTSTVIKGIKGATGFSITGVLSSTFFKTGKTKIIKSFFKSLGGKIVGGITAVAVVSGAIIVFNPKTITITTIPDRIVESSYSYMPYYYEIDSVIDGTGFGTGDDGDINNRYLIEGRLMVLEDTNGKKGVYTIQGQEILPKEFDDIYYEEEIGGVLLVEKDFKYAYFSTDGDMLCDDFYDVADPIEGGFFRYFDSANQEYSIFSFNGERILDSTYYGLQDMINGLAVVQKDDKYGLINVGSEQLLDYIYDDIFLGDGQYIALNQSTKDGVICSVMDWSLNPIYSNLETKDIEIETFDSGFHNGVALLGSHYKDSTFTFAVDANGKKLYIPTEEVLSNDFTSFSVSLYDNGIFYHYFTDIDTGFLFNPMGGLIATTNNYCVISAYDKIIIENRDAYSLVDLKGREIFSGYEMIEVRYMGKYYICSDGYGYDLLDLNGNILFKSADYITSLGSEMFLCSNDGIETIVNGQTGTSYNISEDQNIESAYTDGYIIVQNLKHKTNNSNSRTWYEIFDKNGKPVHSFYNPDPHGVGELKVLKKGIYAYRHNEETYINKWE